MQSPIKSFFRNQRGISPVVATVILISVTIIASVAISYWMGGISSSFARFEELEFKAIYADWDSNMNQWNVTISIRNIGTTDASLLNLLINDKPYDKYENNSIVITNPSDFSTDGLTLDTNESFIFNFSIDNVDGFDHSISIEVELQSASGVAYSKMIVLE